MPPLSNTIAGNATVDYIVSNGIAVRNSSSGAGRCVLFHRIIPSSCLLHFNNSSNGFQQVEAGIREPWGYQATQPELRCGG